MWTPRTIDPDRAHSERLGAHSVQFAVQPGVQLAARASAHAQSLAREFGPLLAAFALGASIGAASTTSLPSGSSARELGLVVLLAAAAAAAILPREEQRDAATDRVVASANGDSSASISAADLRARIARVFATQRLFAVALCAALPGFVLAHGFGAALAWAPVVWFLQVALAVGLALFAAAASATRIGRLLPARILVPAWVLASPGAWLVHAPADASAWNPLYHLVAAWRAILLPGIGTSESLGAALLALAPAALLTALLGFATLAATERREDAPGP
jgi:hypothetical protein